jgi:hypothetical protein
MIDQLKENNYIFIPNFIDKKRALELAEDFETYCIKNNLTGDFQAPNSSSCYNHISLLELLCEKTPEISKLIGETVLPTYTYSRVYKTGDDLKRHRDRPACEISITMNLWKEKDWPIYIQKSNGEEVKVEMEPGDAMLYLGCVADHWRHEINQKKYIQVFLHYVRSRGDCAYAYFDKDKSEKKKSFESTYQKQENQNVDLNVVNNEYKESIKNIKTWNLPYDIAFFVDNDKK